MGNLLLIAVWEATKIFENALVIGVQRYNFDHRILATILINHILIWIDDGIKMNWLWLVCFTFVKELFELFGCTTAMTTNRIVNFP